MKKLLFALLAVFALALPAHAGPNPPADDMDFEVIIEDQVESLFAISMFTHYDQPSSGSGLAGWGGGVDLGYLYTDNVSFHANYAWTDGSETSSFDRHTFLGYAKYSYGEGPISPYARLGGGFESAGGYNLLVSGGLGVDLYLTDEVTAYVGADYLWSHDTPDLTRISLGLRYHFEDFNIFGGLFGD